MGGTFFFKSPKSFKSEREQENFLNENIRKYIKTILDKSSVPNGVIISRACLYKEKRSYGNEITTDEIGDIMDSMYGDRQDDDCENIFIEHFFFFVQVIDGQRCLVNPLVDFHTKALEVLKTLPGDWKPLKPQKTWQGTFFGLFPKETPTMTERDREKLLNGEVRLPLIEKLEVELAGAIERGGIKPKVQVIITRACKYTPIKMDTL